MLGPFKKFSQAIKERGIWGALVQIYMIGETKLGTLKGVDAFGNKYYENLSYPFGQHRWVEYSDIHNFDASMIQPEWHGWMHHVFDETPVDAAKLTIPEQLHSGSNAIYPHHVGLAFAIPQAQINTTTFRQRGYKVGSLKTGPDDPDQYYMQPGHPLSPFADKGGRFKYRKDIQGYLLLEELKDKK